MAGAYSDHETDLLLDEFLDGSEEWTEDPEICNLFYFGADASIPTSRFLNDLPPSVSPTSPPIVYVRTPSTTPIPYELEPIPPSPTSVASPFPFGFDSPCPDISLPDIEIPRPNSPVPGCSWWDNGTNNSIMCPQVSSSSPDSVSIDISSDNICENGTDQLVCCAQIASTTPLDDIDVDPSLWHCDREDDGLFELEDIVWYNNVDTDCMNSKE